MRQQPLDRQMRLAGVGGTEDGGDAGPGCAIAREPCVWRESHIFRVFLVRRLWALRTLKCVSDCDAAVKIWGLCLSLRTSLERIAAESLTPPSNRFRSPQHLAPTH